LSELEPELDKLFVWAEAEKASHLELVERLLGEAAGKKRERSIERRIKDSGLRVRKTLEAFDFNFQPKLERRLIESLMTLSFVERKEDVLFTGKCGTGKSHLLQAIALRACQHEIPTRYARSVDLLDDLYAGLADGTYERRLRAWSRPPLLVIDDVGLGQVRKHHDEPTAAHALFNLLDRRHQQASTILSSNIKLSGWGKYLGDATLAAAILDRLAMNSIRIDIDGPSYRQHIARKRASEQGVELETVDT
jgi:DNA replication protein DnaC